MTTVGAGEATAEVTQSRGASASEALAIFKAQVRDYRLHMPKTPRAKVARTVAVVLALAILALALWMHNVPVPVAIGLFGLLVISSISLLRYGYYWNCAGLYRGGYQANRRFRIEQDALVITDWSGVVQSIPWSAITHIVAHEGVLAIYFSGVNSACLLKAAHENQDVEGFCADVLRRWQAQRGPGAAAS
jgi:hypothetical protein